MAGVWTVPPRSQFCPRQSGPSGRWQGEENDSSLIQLMMSLSNLECFAHRHRETIDIEIIELDGGADKADEGDAGGGI